MATNDEIDRFLDEVLRVAGRRDQASRAALPGSVATAAQGLTFGFGDEITAGVRSLFGTPYRRALAEERANVEQYRAERPVLATGLEVAGSLPTLLIPGLGVTGQAARAATTGSRVAQAAAAGANAGMRQGALQGVGDAEGGVGAMAAGAAVGAGVGAGVGALGGAAIEGARPLVQRAVQGARDIGNPQGAAERLLAQQVARDQPAPGAALRAVEASAADRGERLAAGLPDTGTTLAEAMGPNSRTALEALAQQPGEAMANLTRQLDTRQNTRMDRILEALKTTFGDAEDAYVRQQALFAQRTQEAGPLYTAVRSNNAPLQTDLDVSLWRRAQPAAGDARTISTLEGRPATANSQPTIADLMSAKEGLDQLIERELRGSGRGSPVSVSARRLRDQIVDRLDELTVQPDGTSLYRQARLLWAGPSAHNDALDLGQNIFRTRPTELRATIDRMTDTERMHFVEGGMNALRDRLRNVPRTGTANPVRAIFDTDMERDQIRVLTDALGLPPGDAARRFDLLARYLGAGPTALGSETAGAAFENTVLRNSATARRQAAMQELATGAAGGGAAGGLSEYWLGGGFGPGAAVGATVGLAGAGARRVMQGSAERRNDALARLLSTTDPTQQAAAARRVDAVLAAEAARRGGINPMLAARAGSLLGTSVPADELRRGLLD
ncbi:hypothetical protein UFOVP397_19 [uncultured Caudovirales phage]|uniref:Uncharacterized protein n=1 Tax=uncultured Caudovirales phage TaxID=2100421 RepID=A0A6J5M329_9CAUD|nr:hypothetical protein UFOVP397_19 [uncultured Caudovirales phage]